MNKINKKLATLLMLCSHAAFGLMTPPPPKGQEQESAIIQRLRAENKKLRNRVRQLEDQIERLGEKAEAERQVERAKQFQRKQAIEKARAKMRPGLMEEMQQRLRTRKQALTGPKAHPPARPTAPKPTRKIGVPAPKRPRKQIDAKTRRAMQESFNGSLHFHQKRLGEV